MAHKKKQFINFEPLSLQKNKIFLKNNTILFIYSQSNIEISMINIKIIWITNVIYILDLQKNLFSISDYDQQGDSILIKNYTYQILV